MKDIKEIGFYTLSNKRAINATEVSRLQRCEIILTDKCNFKCLYCRGLRADITGEMTYEQAKYTLSLWIKDGLKNIRFSGGEPLLYKHLPELIKQAKLGKVERIAISTNGSLSLDFYRRLIDLGVNDMSISLDGCCSNIGDKMSGIKGSWDKVTNNIKELSKITYVTVGMVFTENNISECKEAVLFADSLGVSDIRVIPSAQYNKALLKLSELSIEILNKYPILKYRIDNLKKGIPIRGINNHNKCRLVLDDMAVAGDKHFPCIIYMREQGNPIGIVGPNMRIDRKKWMEKHKPHKDPICKEMCLDVCVAYNKVANKNA